MFDDIDPKVLELSIHACSQLFADKTDQQYQITYSDKEIVSSEILKLTARYTQELYMKWMDRFDFPYEWKIVRPRDFAQLILFVYDGTITEKQAKEQVFPYMWDNYLSPEWAILDLKILQSKSNFDLNSIVDKYILENPKQVEQYKSGNEKIIGFFMGKIMKETEGCFDPGTIKETLTQKLI